MRSRLDHGDDPSGIPHHRNGVGLAGRHSICHPAVPAPGDWLHGDGVVCCCRRSGRQAPRTGATPRKGGHRTYSPDPREAAEPEGQEGPPLKLRNPGGMCRSRVPGAKYRSTMETSTSHSCGGHQGSLSVGHTAPGIPGLRLRGKTPIPEPGPGRGDRGR